MPGFVNHHVHSYFSILDGMPSPKDIVSRAVELGQSSVSVTDHGSLSGIPSMYKEAKKAGIGFTPGCEVYFTRNRHVKSTDNHGEAYYHLILLAYNNEGYHNLVKMQTPAWEEGFWRKPRVDWELLEKYHSGLIVTSACLGSSINSALVRGDIDTARDDINRLASIFGKENTYIEIQRHGMGVESELLKKQVALAKETGLELLATCDSHYCCPEDHDHHDSLITNSVLAKKSDEKRFSFDGTNYYMHSAEEMLELFPEDKYPRAVSNTVKIAERTDFSMPYDEKQYVMPVVKTDDGLSQEDFLRKKVLEGASEQKRYGDENGNISQEVIDRIDYELGVIANMKFSGYFLIVQRIVELLAENDIRVGAGRGSAPGSVVVYCLGITNVDPFAHNLYFERFLNPDRISMPDIDMDIPKSKRQEALRLIQEEYGHGHVAHLSNYGSMKLKDTLERMSKVFGLTPSEADKFKGAVSKYCDSYGATLKELEDMGAPPEEIADEIQQDYDTYRKIISASAHLEGTMTQLGVHASGVVITDAPIDNYFPIRVSKKAYLPVCQFDGEDTEALGGVKIDLLGLINLDECEFAEDNIAIDLGIDVDSSSLPLDDEEVYELISQGRGGGVFQLGCVSGDTIVDGQRIDSMYLRKNSGRASREVRSVFMGEGDIRKNRVLDVVYSGVKKVYRVSTSNHKSLNATSNHKVFTQRGWVSVGELDTTGDFVVSVNNSVSDDFYQSIRGREDVIEFFASMNPGYRRIEDDIRSPITLGSQTFYPTFASVSEFGNFCYIYPDTSYWHAQKVVEEAQEQGMIVKAYSYSQVMETYQAHHGVSSTELPEGAEWVRVISVESAGEEDTYDIMMQHPVNNFIADGIMVHNSSGIRSLARNMKPDTFDDLSAILALYRPGPMGTDTPSDYCDHKNAPEKRKDNHHPDMDDLLSSTHGLVVYQEDIMALARHFAGYSGAEADELRKAVAKKIPAMMEEQKNKFIPAVNNSFGNNLGNRLWNIIEPFGAYAFNKSHSAAYAMLVYRTAWLKKHYPAQFSAACIDQNLDDKKKLVETISWVRQEGVSLSTPDINKSENRSTTTIDAVTLPLHIISGLGKETVLPYIAEREENGEYKSVTDFVSRNKISKNNLINLAKSGAFDSLGASRAAVVEKVDTIISIAATNASVQEVSNGLFGEFVESQEEETLIDLSSAPEKIMNEDKFVNVDDDLYAKWEREALGILVGNHPFSTLMSLNSAQGILKKYRPIDEFDRPSERALFSGMITDIENRLSKRQTEFCKFSIETGVAVVDAVVFKHIPEELEGSIILAEGSIKDDAYGGHSEGFTPSARCYIIKRLDVDKLKERG